MMRLGIVTACFAMLVALPSIGHAAGGLKALPAPSVSDSATLAIAEASQRFGVPARWIRAVIRAESFGDPRAVSLKGAAGMMQVMPSTYAALAPRLHLGPDPCDIQDNVLAGTAYLRLMFNRYGPIGMAGAYNAGPARWGAYLAGLQPLPSETAAYLVRLAPVFGFDANSRSGGPVAALRPPAEPALFVPLTREARSTDGQAERRRVVEIIAANPTIVSATGRMFGGTASAADPPSDSLPAASTPAGSALFAPSMQTRARP